MEIAGERKVSKAKVLTNVFLTILTENRVMILACLEHREEIDSNVTAAQRWAKNVCEVCLIATRDARLARWFRVATSVSVPAAWTTCCETCY